MNQVPFSDNCEGSANQPMNDDTPTKSQNGHGDHAIPALISLRTISCIVGAVAFTETFLRREPDVVANASLLTVDDPPQIEHQPLAAVPGSPRNRQACRGA
jgi:hypothetical protein